MSPNVSFLRPSCRPFNTHEFYLDFAKEIFRRRFPLYPATGFFGALRIASEKDTARWLRYCNDLNLNEFKRHENYIGNEDFQESDLRALDGRLASLKKRNDARRAALTKL